MYAKLNENNCETKIAKKDGTHCHTSHGSLLNCMIASEVRRIKFPFSCLFSKTSPSFFFLFDEKKRKKTSLIQDS